mgnify:CR=1 FL=1
MAAELLGKHDDAKKYRRLADQIKQRFNDKFLKRATGVYGVTQTRIGLTAAGRGHPMYVDKHDVFDAITVHLDEVETLAPNMRVLAANTYSQVQAAEIRINGTTAPDARRKMAAAGYSNIHGLMKGCDNYWHGIATQNGHDLIANFLAIAGIKHKRVAA